MSAAATRSWRYRHYGLTIGSNVALEGLPPAPPGPIDVELDFMRAASCPAVGAPWVMIDPPRTAWRAGGATGSRLRLQFHGTNPTAGGGEWVEFLVEDGGARVAIVLGEQVDLGEAVELLLTSVFSCVHMQRGATCLHASVVALGDRAFALVGPRGAGKSTLALALVQRGARLVSDDVAVLSEREGATLVAVGRPQLRIREDSAEALSGSYATLRPVWVHEDARPRKRYHDLPEAPAGVTPGPVALAGVFLLAPRAGETPRVRAVSAAELLPGLIANRHMAPLQEREGHRRDFVRLASIAARLPGRELRRPDDLSAAPTAADAVLDEIRRGDRLNAELVATSMRHRQTDEGTPK